MRSRIIDLDGPVHVADFGGSGTPIVLVHGLGGSHANWLAVGERLAEHGRVLAPDLAGFGRTPLAGRSSGVGANRALLDRFLGATCDEPAVLVGNSMGGLISLMEASLRPEKVAALVLVGPAQPRPLLVAPDWRIMATFAAYAMPMVGETFVRWRSRLLGPEGVVRQTLELCCVDSSRIAPEVFAAHVALAEERASGMPWAAEAFLGAARSIVTRTAARGMVPRAGAGREGADARRPGRRGPPGAGPRLARARGEPAGLAPRDACRASATCRSSRRRTASSTSSAPGSMRCARRPRDQRPSMSRDSRVLQPPSAAPCRSASRAARRSRRGSVALGQRAVSARTMTAATVLRFAHESLRPAQALERAAVGRLVVPDLAARDVPRVLLPDARAEAARLDQHHRHAGRGHLHPERVGEPLERVLGRLYQPLSGVVVRP
jgi:pimeloyl-ACP methyl ester carboxylesterase